MFTYVIDLPIENQVLNFHTKLEISPGNINSHHTAQFYVQSPSSEDSPKSLSNTSASSPTTSFKTSLSRMFLPDGSGSGFHSGTSSGTRKPSKSESAPIANIGISSCSSISLSTRRPRTSVLSTTFHPGSSSSPEKKT